MTEGRVKNYGFVRESMEKFVLLRIVHQVVIMKCVSEYQDSYSSIKRL